LTFVSRGELTCFDAMIKRKGLSTTLSTRLYLLCRLLFDGGRSLVSLMVDLDLSLTILDGVFDQLQFRCQQLFLTSTRNRF